MKAKNDISNQTKKITLIFAIAFSIMLIFVISFSTAYFSDISTAGGEITLGELNFCISATKGENETVMPNMFVGQTATISNSRNADGSNHQNLCDILYRFSIFVLIDGEIDSNITDDIYFDIDSQKYVQEGNILYYVGVLKAGQIETLYQDVFLDYTIENMYQNREISFVISVDAIQAENGAYLDLWQDAPTEWLEQIKTILV